MPRLIAACLVLLSLSSRTVTADAASTAKPNAWLPGSGRFSAAIATGVPFLVMSELSVGITDHAALGVLGGTTPIVSGFGLRPRGAVSLGDHAQLLLSAPVIFYPARADGPAWWLARPSFELAVDVSERWNLAAGAGAVGVATQEAVFGGDDGPTGTSAYGRQLNAHRVDAWWTLNALASVAVSDRTQLFADATLVFRGVRPAGSDWIGGPPFILFLGVNTCL